MAVFQLNFMRFMFYQVRCESGKDEKINVVETKKALVVDKRRQLKFFVRF
jgi:hypothetical protein